MKNNKKIEGFEGEMLHPSLDMKENLLVLGFRYKTKTGEEQDLLLLVQNGAIEVLEDDSFEVGDKRYVIEKKGRRLIRIQERWSLEDLNALRKEYADAKANPIADPQDVFKKIQQTVAKYVELEKDIDYSLLAAWMLGTYFHPIFPAYPFLNAKAPKHSGKSQLLNLFRQTCFNAVKARPTLAALGDTVDSLRGTYLIDQADSLGRKGTEELLDILADSYKKSGGKRRIIEFDKNKSRKVVEFETYGPKVFASTRDLPEDLRDRCLIVPLMRSQRNFSDPDEEGGNWKELRALAYRLLVGHHSQVAAEYTLRRLEGKLDQRFVGRTRELWLPLEIMLRVCGMEGELAEAKRRFLSLYGFAEWEPSDLDRRVVEVVVKELGEADKVNLSPSDIAEQIDVDLFPPRATTKNNKATRVGWIITNLNISSDKGRVGGGVIYVFERHQVEKVYKAYFPTSPTPDAPEADDAGSPADVGGGV